MTAGAVREAIAEALRHANTEATITAARDLSGGCIHRVMEVTLSNGQCVVAKINDADSLAMFEEEAVSLRALEATRTVLTPRVLTVGRFARDMMAVLLMTRITSPSTSGGQHASETMWSNFGRDLAALHTAALPAELARGYGFTTDNHLGSTPQPNGWIDDWVEFNALHRLGHQVRLARSRGLLTPGESSRLDQVIARLDRLLPRKPHPSLLHGDLWSGNALPAARGITATCAVIDPACSVGDALADIGMMQLFGGFSAACFDAWSDRMNIELNSNESATRLAVYQLYHVLNHVNIFGRGYAGQAMSLARRLV